MSDIQTVLREGRVFPPSAALPPSATRKPRRIRSDVPAIGRVARGVPGPEMAGSLHWFQPWDRGAGGNSRGPSGSWAARPDLSYNCLDRQLEAGKRNKAALLWEGEPGDRRTLTYGELHHEVCRCANVLKNLGIVAGDQVGIYMPLIPEAAIAMLALRAHRGDAQRRLRRLLERSLGRPHERCAGEAHHHRRWRLAQGAVVELKRPSMRPSSAMPSVRTSWSCGAPAATCALRSGPRDHWWHEVRDGVSAVCPAEPVDAGIRRSSCTRAARPAGRRESCTTGGYMVGTWLTTRYVFDLRTTTFTGVPTRHWLDHRAFVCGVRTVGEWRHRLLVRGRAEFPAARPLVEDDRRSSREHLVHRADRDSHLHPLGRAASAPARSGQLAAAGFGRRADQPRGLDVVPRGHRQGTLSDRRHVVADGNGRDHDHTRTGCRAHEAGVGDAAFLRCRAGCRGTRWGFGGARGRRLARVTPAVAGDVRTLWGDPIAT